DSVPRQTTPPAASAPPIVTQETRGMLRARRVPPNGAPSAGTAADRLDERDRQAGPAAAPPSAIAEIKRRAVTPADPDAAGAAGGKREARRNTRPPAPRGGARGPPKRGPPAVSGNAAPAPAPAQLKSLAPPPAAEQKSAAAPRAQSTRDENAAHDAVQGLPS